MFSCVFLTVRIFSQQCILRGPCSCTVWDFTPGFILWRSKNRNTRLSNQFQARCFHSYLEKDSLLYSSNCLRCNLTSVSFPGSGAASEGEKACSSFHSGWKRGQRAPGSAAFLRLGECYVTAEDIPSQLSSPCRRQQRCLRAVSAKEWWVFELRSRCAITSTCQIMHFTSMLLFQSTMWLFFSLQLIRVKLWVCGNLFVCLWFTKK